MSGQLGPERKSGLVAGRPAEDVNRELHGQRMQTVATETQEDRNILSMEKDYHDLKASKFRSGKYDGAEVKRLEQYLSAAESYLQNAPTSKYRSFYARKYFDDAIETVYLLRGREEAEKWAAGYADVLAANGFKPEAVALSARVKLDALDGMAKSFGWRAPVFAQ